MEIEMTKQMNATAVAQIRSQMDAAKTANGARKAMAKLALTRNNLTDCGRAEWLKELA
jgi:predicted 2-oxoglutarate/Fe(II)-dependent dioxygenase YbiX